MKPQKYKLPRDQEEQEEEHELSIQRRIREQWRYDE